MSWRNTMEVRKGTLPCGCEVGIDRLSSPERLRELERDGVELHLVLKEEDMSFKACPEHAKTGYLVRMGTFMGPNEKMEKWPGFKCVVPGNEEVTKKLFLLFNTEADHDETVDMLIRAECETEARSMASIEATTDLRKRDQWMNSIITKCTEIPLEGPSEVLLKEEL